MFFLLLFASILIIPSTSQTLTDHEECDVVLSVHSSTETTGCRMTDIDDYDVATGSMHIRCSSMEDMLKAIAIDLIEVGVNCTELRIPPGEHVVQGNYTFTGKNLRIVNYEESSAIVHFDTNVSIINSLQELEPLYVWRFESCYRIEIIGLLFVDSFGIISFSNVTYLTVADSTFENFLESSMDILNSHYVTITNCTFKHCGHNADILKDYRFSIHSGAISITQNNLDEIQEPFITVHLCTFYNNSAIPSANLVRSTNQVFANQIFTGRGGALGIAANAAGSQMNISIIDCHFKANTASSWGGAVYIIFGIRSNHVATALKTVFVRNRSLHGAGALFIGTLSGGFPDFFSTSNVISCDFIENQAVHGGGVVWPEAQAEGTSEIIYNRGLYENCRFINNSASNFGALAFATGGAGGGYRTQSGSTAIEISNCTFIGNNGEKTPAFGTLYIPVSFLGHNIFDSNIGGAIQIIGCRASINGKVEIKNSEVVDTFLGALTLTSLAQLTLFKGARLIFNNNTGSLGSGLYAEAPRVSQVFAGTIYNPLCSFLYEDSYIPPDEWEDVGVSFIGNKALAGAAVLTTQLSTCSWSHFDHPYFNITRAFRWNFIKFGINEDTFHDEQSESSMFYVQTVAQRISILNESFSVYPGENFVFFIKTLDELGHPMFSAIHAIQGNDVSDFTADHHALFVLHPSVYALKSRSESYSASVRMHDGTHLNKSYPVSIKSITNTLDYDVDSNTMILISLKECPPGFVLQAQTGDEDFLICACNFKNSVIRTCVDESVVFRKNVWATADNDATDKLFVHHCPTGYCGCSDDLNGSNCYNTYDHIHPDNQCIRKRKGILCGECSSGDEGVSVLLNKCVSCHAGYSSLIPLLVIMDVGVVFLMTRYLLCHQYPSWLFPCIFYVQFLPYGSSFISNGFSLFHPYMLYVSSALSFYFPYDFCLYSNMSALVSYSLRYLPFVIILVTSTLVILYCWYFTDLARSKEWYLVWIFVILNYQFILYNSMTILNCPTVPTDEGKKGFWFVSGNIECFTGGHIPLALFAILMIILLTAMIPVSFFMSLKIIEHPIWLKRIQRPLQLWYKEDYKWWFSVELARRFILTLMIVPFNGNVYPAVFVYCVTFGLFVYVQPYKSFYANLLEIIFSMTSIIFFNLDGHLQFQFQSDSSDTYFQRPLLWIGGILYYVPLLVTCPLVIAHVCFEAKRRYQKLQQRNRNRNLKKKEENVSMTRLYSSANQIKSSAVPSTTVTLN